MPPGSCSVSVAPGAHEGALAHPGAPRERGDAQVVGEVVGHPALQLAQLGASRRSGAQLRGELRLAAGSPDEHHEPGGDLVGQLGAVVVLDQRQRQVDAGGDAGRGPTVPVVDVDAVLGDAAPPGGPCELVARRPVRRRLVAVEQAGGGEQQGTAADRRGPSTCRDATPRGGRRRSTGSSAATRTPSPPTTISVSTPRSASAAVRQVSQRASRR